MTSTLKLSWLPHGTSTRGARYLAFYRWYARLQAGGPEALEDKPSPPSRVWNRIPDEVRDQIIDLALEDPELSPRELAVRFTDDEELLCIGGFGLSAAQGA